MPMLAVPHFPPRTARVRKTAKVCMVKAMSPWGMQIQAQIAISAAKRAQRTIFLTDE